MFVYGAPGVGKTYFLSTAQDFPDTSPLLILSAEGGMATLRRRSDIHVIELRTRDELSAVYEKLWKASLRNELPYKCIGFDTFSEFMKVDMDSIMREAISKNSNQNPDVPSPREWGIYLSHARKIVRSFRDLPCHVIFTAHTQEKYIDDITVSFRPNIQGQGVRELPGFFDIIGYYRMSGSKRVMQFRETERVNAKDRFTALGDNVESPSVALLWEKIFSE